ncbi:MULTISPECIES: hypothetical protein [Pseudomonadaceae]|jgi:hypothetical protein|uniref:hypothetical protein n=1 Tax=Pseudomonadaceae TaxID=135621 RepID=UPI0005EAF529|nr:hypothetical protein [Stutzerimonas stutzeri]
MNEQPERTFEAQPEPAPQLRDSLWLLTLGPAIWAVHFLLCYVAAAVWCAKLAGRAGPLGDLRTAIGVLTLVALVGIALVGWRGWRGHTFGTATAPHDFDTPADRHRFLGFSTLLLSGLSFVATVFVALSVVFIGSCE